MSSPSYMTESSSSSSSRPQAGPLPPKVGELAYVPTDNYAPSADLSPADAADISLHPHPAESNANLPLSSLPVNNNDSSRDPPPPSGFQPHDTASMHSSKSFAARFLRGDPSKPMPTYRGMRLSTLLRVGFILFAFVGTIIGWALTIAILQQRNNRRNTLPDPNKPHNSSDAQPTSTQSLIFIHVAFGLMTILLLIFLERAVFLARAEHYRFLNPLTSSSSPRNAVDGQGRTVDPTTMAYAPWNRPSLPTYASALGFRGTGDVEDAAIAAPPPPEYGNTRGSTLLLSTMLQRASLRGRPVSYATATSPVESHHTLEDGPGEGAESDARRARRLEETLAVLESGESLSVPAPVVVRQR